MTTYTVLSPSGETEAENVSLEQAAHAVLSYDGYEYEIRPADDGEGFELWTSNASRTSTSYKGLRKSVIFSVETDRAAAEADIYKQVCNFDPEWNGCEVNEA